MKIPLVKFLQVLEEGFAILALLILTGGRGGRSLIYIVHVVTPLLIIARWKSTALVTMRGKALVAFIGFILVSVLWSVAPQITLSRSFTLIQVTLFGVYFAARYSLSKQLRLLAWALGIAAVLSLVFSLAIPSYGRMTGMHAGAWQGLYRHKNKMGSIMVLGALVFILQAKSSRRYRYVTWAFVGLCVFLILLSTSKSALVMLISLLTLLPLYSALRWSYTWKVPFFIAVILVGGSAAIWLVSSAESILDSMGKDLTLSGRTPLWSVLIEMIGKHPWLGYGFKAFWRGYNSEESAYVWQVVHWQPPHSHNAFIDLCLDFGLLGLSVFLLGFVTALFQAVACVSLSKTAVGLWPLIYLTFVLFSNQTESVLLSLNYPVFWVLYVTISLSKGTHDVKVIKPNSIKTPSNTKIIET